MAQNGVASPPPELSPATLPGSPANFPIGEEDLIRRARYVYIEAGNGVKDPSVLADSFRFEFPIVSLDKKKYLDAVKSFELEKAIPNLDTHPYHWRVDPFERNRVWFTTRSTGTHTGPLKFAGMVIKPTNREYYSAPECMSYVFNPDGKVATFTGGYVMDKRVGNTEGWGALFGILTALGQPRPGSTKFFLRFAIENVLRKTFYVANFLTFGLLQKVIKVD